MAVTIEQVAKIYVATFNRAPDAAGLDYWVHSSFGGNPSIEQIASSFFDSPEAQAQYTPQMTTTEKVTMAYANLFNRAPDEAGLAYWVEQLDTGAVSQSNMLIALVNGALNTEAGQDATIMANKTTVGLSFANAELNDTELAKSVMTNVDATQGSVDAAESVIVQNTPVFAFSVQWLAGKTFYNVYDDNNDGVFEMDAITFNANGTGHNNGEYGWENFTYSVDAQGIMTLFSQYGTWYVKAIQQGADNVAIAWGNTYEQALNATISNESFFTSQNAADAYIAANEPFSFSAQWLAGKTLYDVADENYDDRVLDTIITMQFHANGTLSESMGGQSMQGTWSVNADHTIVIQDAVGTWWMRSSGMSVQGENDVIVYSEDVYSRFETNGWFTAEAMAFDYATAQTLLGVYLEESNVFLG